MKLFRGFSLVELLVAMTLGVFLSGVAILAYLGAKQASFYDEQVARLQENGTYALRLLTRELVMAGFRGRAVVQGDFATPGGSPTNCSSIGWALDWSTPLQFVLDYRGSSTPTTVEGDSLVCLENGSPSAGSDMIVVRRSAAEPSVYRGTVAPQLTRSSGFAWFLRDELGVAQGWERLRPRDLPRLATLDVRSSYWEAVGKIYFVRDYSQELADAVPTLCAKTLAGSVVTTRCIIEGVEQIQLQIGLDLNGDGAVNHYVSTPHANQLPQAVSVRVSVLVRSIDPVAQRFAERTYQLADQLFTVNDSRYIRRVFRMTVPLRNSPYAHG